jgi:hypothetical protein
LSFELMLGELSNAHGIAVGCRMALG